MAFYVNATMASLSNLIVPGYEPHAAFYTLLLAIPSLILIPVFFFVIVAMRWQTESLDFLETMDVALRKVNPDKLSFEYLLKQVGIDPKTMRYGTPHDWIQFYAIAYRAKLMGKADRP